MGLSYAELTRATNEVLKTAIMLRKDMITEQDIRLAIAERLKLSEQMMNPPIHFFNRQSL